MGAVRHRFTAEEYRKMGEAGIFSEDDRVELIDGEVVEMTPIGWRHAQCVTRLNTLLARFAGEQALAGRRYEISVQNPVALSRHREPQPDLALLESLPPGRLPGPAEVALVVEVADTSVAYDRECKLPLYAGAGIPEAWLIDLNADVIEVHSEPEPAGYRRITRLQREGRVVSITLPGLAFDVAEVLPPEG
ncbi:MAG: Uma2 family endonuclease [Actinobacteria bacterium]|nr:Uma2 family endonuclease [Actinomycetota bacterium]